MSDVAQFATSFAVTFLAILVLFGGGYLWFRWRKREQEKRERAAMFADLSARLDADIAAAKARGIAIEPERIAPRRRISF